MTLQPLMQRVQAALKDQLTRQNEKLEIDLREQVHVCIHTCIIFMSVSSTYMYMCMYHE